MIRLVRNEEHLSEVMAGMLNRCRHRLFISTADLKDMHLPAEMLPGPGRGRAASIMKAFARLSKNGVRIHLLHSSAPSGPMLEELKRGIPQNLTMRMCPRVHAKAVIADGTYMYVGSANLTGAGLGAKGANRRNFEIGVCTDDVSLIDPAMDMLEEIFHGGRCEDCDRKEHCPEPLEEPRL